MKLTLLITMSALLLVACSRQSSETPPDRNAPISSGIPVTASVDYEALTDQGAYELACASCHAEGVDGAPITENREDWENRSALWEAVLLEHAKLGYFAMPPKGGHEELPDFVVERAAEYMLELTFPERQPD